MTYIRVVQSASGWILRNCLHRSRLVSHRLLPGSPTRLASIYQIKKDVLRKCSKLDFGLKGYLCLSLANFCQFSSVGYQILSSANCGYSTPPCLSLTCLATNSLSFGFAIWGHSKYTIIIEKEWDSSVLFFVTTLLAPRFHRNCLNSAFLSRRMHLWKSSEKMLILLVVVRSQRRGGLITGEGNEFEGSQRVLFVHII